MRSTGRDVRVALAALALVLVACSTSARASDVPEQLRALFESGSKGTPSAVAAAKAKYDALHAAHPTDPRIDYAYGVVLINQRKYREATEMLARYLATDNPRLTAYCLQIGALVPLREFSKVLEQAVALAERLHAEAGGGTGANRQDAAQFLGMLFKYLELSRKDAPDARLLDECNREVVALLDESDAAAYLAGYNAAAKRHGELRAQYETQQEQVKERIEGRQERDKFTAEQARSASEAAVEKSKYTKQQLREVQRRYGELQRQMTPLVMQRGILESGIVTRQSLIKQNQKARDTRPEATQALNDEIDFLKRQIRQLDLQIEPLRVIAAKLESQAATHHFALAKAEDTSFRSERIGTQANRRIERADDKLGSRSGVAESRLTLFSSYAPFSYELERKRVLGWFRK